METNIAGTMATTHVMLDPLGLKIKNILPCFYENKPF
jgi:hypothetical protein